MLRYIVNIVFLVLLSLTLILDWMDKIHFFWAVIPLIITYLAIHTYGAVSVSFQFFTPILCHGHEKSGAISITFDDGPLPDKTQKILDILRDHQAPAAFFCIGNRVQRSPELVIQIHAEGHIVGNHTYLHSGTFDLQSSQKMSSELQSADQAVEDILRLRPRFFRPPYGVTNPNLAKAIRKGKYITIGWSVRSFDTVIRDKEKLFRRVTRNLKAGDIVLFHDYCDSTIEMLPDFLNHVSKLGLKVVRVDQLLNESPYA